jgi:hypothetical protein
MHGQDDHLGCPDGYGEMHLSPQLRFDGQKVAIHPEPDCRIP